MNTVAIVGSGPCLKDVDLGWLAANREVATLNGMARHVAHPRWAFMQEPQSCREFAPFVEDDCTTIVYGQSTYLSIFEERFNDGIYVQSQNQRDWHHEPEKRAALREILATKNTEHFHRDHYSWITHEGFVFCPNDCAVLFALAYFAELDDKPDKIELYGIDLNRTKKQRSVFRGGGGDKASVKGLRRLIPYYPIPVLNCCPSSEAPEFFPKEKEAVQWP